MNKKSMLITGLLLVLTFIITRFISDSSIDEIIDDMVFNAVSIFVGLLVAIVGIFLGSINSIYVSIFKFLKTNDSELTDDEIKDIKSGIEGLITELKQNTMFSLFSFLVIILLILFKYMDIPSVRWFIEDGFYTKAFALNHLVLFLTSLIFYAIVDSTYTIFKITEAFRIEKENEDQ